MIAPVASAPPRVLYLCLENPWRLDAGGLIRNYWIVRALAKRFAVDLVTAGDPHEPIPADFAAICASIRCFPAPGRAARIARALAPGATLFTAGGVSAAMRRAVAEQLRGGNYGAIVADLNMVDAIPAGCGVPLVYNAHNCEAALLRRRARFERSAVRRFVTAVDARRLAPIEARTIDRSALVAACSMEDIADLAALAPSARAKAVVVPNGVDVARYAEVVRTPPQRGRVLVTGSFDWQPNRLGLRWFLREVVPLLEPLLGAGEGHVRVAGRMDAALAAEIDAVPGVQAAPNVPDMRDELAGAEIVVAPILVSSGTRLRVLEAWAAGRPVVTTPAGAFGLPYTEGVDMVVREAAPAFAAAIADLIRDDDRRALLRAGGLRRARSYDWSRVAETLLDACSARVPAGATP